MVGSNEGCASVIKIWVLFSGVESVAAAAANSSMSLTRLASGFPTTDMKDGNGVDTNDPISTWGIVEYLVG